MLHEGEIAYRCVIIDKSYALFTLDVGVCVCVNVTVNLTLTLRMGSDTFCAFVFASLRTIDAILNFDGDFDANASADVKCEHTFNRSGSEMFQVGGTVD